MTKLLNHIAHFMDVHPIRFWGGLALGFVIILAFSLWIITRKKGVRIRFKRNRVLIVTSIVMLVLALSVGAFYLSKNNIKYSPTKCIGCQDGYLDINATYTFGIDISHYQGIINWEDLNKSSHPIQFIIARSTMGKNGVDNQYKSNWKNIKTNKFIRGAYHYYRPNENSTKQFENFKKQVTLNSGDLPPVLDVEKASVFGKENLREGVKNWLLLAEEHYGVKPILYSGKHFYETQLKGHVDGYPLWIAAYSGKHRVKNMNWTFHQFTEKAKVKGIRGRVDANDFNGTKSELQALCIQ